MNQHPTQDLKEVSLKRRVFDAIDASSDNQSRNNVNGIVRKFMIILLSLNLLIIIFETLKGIPQDLLIVFHFVDFVSVIIFSVEYFLRILSADLVYPEDKPWVARVKYIFSFMGLIDLMATLPFFLVSFIPIDLRVLRLFKFNRYTSGIKATIDVIKRKKNQLLSVTFVMLILMVISSLLMFATEHKTQPEIFDNFLAGLWWTAMTLTTGGYGDVYPLTVYGRIFGAIIALLGIALVAVPTGIISSGFVEKIDDKDTEDALFKYLPKKLITPKICLHAVRSCGTNLRFIPREDRGRAICLAAVQSDGNALQYVPYDSRDEEICLEAVENNGEALQYVPKTFLQDQYKEFYKKICLIAVRKRGKQSNVHILEYVPKKFRDEDLFVAAIQEEKSLFDLIPPERITLDLCLTAVSQNPDDFQHIPEGFRTPEFYSEAVEKIGELNKIPKEYRNYDVCLAAIKEDGGAIKYVPEKYLTLELCRIAARHWIDVADLSYIPEEFRNNEDFLNDFANCYLNGADYDEDEDESLDDESEIIESTDEDDLEDDTCNDESDDEEDDIDDEEDVDDEDYDEDDEDWEEDDDGDEDEKPRKR